MKVAFISGHITLRPKEFEEHYRGRIDMALAQGCSFVVGDADGADAMAQHYLKGKTDRVTVYHKGEQTRNNAGFPTQGGFRSHNQKDAAMTNISDFDIAWVRPGREESGTGRNLKRRRKYESEQGHLDIRS